MTKVRVKRAAELRGIYFNTERRWLNPTVGYGYEFYNPYTLEFFQADTLEGAYSEIMSYPKVR